MEELNGGSLQFVEKLDLQLQYDEDYLNELRAKAHWLKDVKPDDWLREIRGYNT